MQGNARYSSRKFNLCTILRWAENGLSSLLKSARRLPIFEVNNKTCVRQFNGKNLYKSTCVRI